MIIVPFPLNKVNISFAKRWGIWYDVHKATAAARFFAPRQANGGRIMDYTTRSPRQTEQLGRAFGAQLQPGERVAFYGGLGAGKTAFIRGLAAGLGIQEPVTSPTYTVVNEYLSGRVPLFHFDLYRLSGADDLFDIGWEDYLQRSGICAVEWSENAPEALEGAIEVRITPGADDESRIISITGGERFADLSD